MKKRYGHIKIDLSNGIIFINGEEIDRQKKTYYNFKNQTHGELAKIIVELYNNLVSEEDRAFL